MAGCVRCGAAQTLRMKRPVWRRVLALLVLRDLHYCERCGWRGTMARSAGAAQEQAARRYSSKSTRPLETVGGDPPAAQRDINYDRIERGLNDNRPRPPKPPASDR